MGNETLKIDIDDPDIHCIRIKRQFSPSFCGSVISGSLIYFKMLNLTGAFVSWEIASNSLYKANHVHIDGTSVC